MHMVRVELHGASEQHYSLLHERMYASGYAMYITGAKASYALPPAEYRRLQEDDSTVEAIRIMSRLWSLS